VAQATEDVKPDQPGMQRQATLVPDVPVETGLLFLQFLQSWLLDHILRTDRQYAAFFEAKGVR
jgi:hypothetical protein